MSWCYSAQLLGSLQKDEFLRCRNTIRRLCSHLDFFLAHPGIHFDLPGMRDWKPKRGLVSIWLYQESEDRNLLRGN